MIVLNDSNASRNQLSEGDKPSGELCLYIWQHIATLYNGNPAVAAYDLYNEPPGKT